MKTKRNWHFNGFHGWQRCALRVPSDAKEGDKIMLTPSQAKRLAHCCFTGCLCGEAPYSTDYDREGHPIPYLILPAKGAEISGHYPSGGR